MRTYQQASRLLRRAVGVLAAAAGLAAGTSVLASPPAMASPAPPAAEPVTTGPARSLGEPAAAQDTAVSAVTATSFGTAGAQAAVWTKPAGSTAWQKTGAVLPAGFGSSYDPAAAAGPSGPLLVVAGTAPPGEKCIANGSVAIASVNAQGALGTPTLVNDQRGTGSFDDRPTVAVGRNGMVWVAWSQGPDADACQDVGSSDQIEVAVSSDGGQTFGAPVTMPLGGGHSAFGVRLAPLPGGQVAVSWTETMPAGDQAVLVSVLGASGQPQQPVPALTGPGSPLVLPGASFYNFPAGDIVALPDGQLMVAAPFWVSGRSVIKLAVGTPGGQWLESDVSPPAGADLLLPALGVLSPGDVRLLCAVHTRQGDRLGYDWTDVSTAGLGPVVSSAGLTALTSSPPGPGFFEIGEELSLAPAQGGLITAMVVAGRGGAALETATFSATPAAAASPTAQATPTSSPAAAGSAATAGASGSTASAPSAGQAASGSSGFSAQDTWLAVAALCALAAAALLLWRRNSKTARPAQYRQETRYRQEPQYRQEPRYNQNPQYPRDPRYNQQPRHPRDPRHPPESRYPPPTRRPPDARHPPDARYRGETPYPPETPYGPESPRRR